uniref:alpha-N-acetyl-neuraminyl-2,3-beta-galactosyl-1, 3-N-acetyl-galactosaminide alpha-2,6-sialyltransferase n=1 Tax=Urocitellus parryii TaxID=9999 RepID=UPI000E55FA64|nr:alpha-N-acetyl-neuraminyl-2,3-beta-galactosyl-1,3-N-acetyl-galactosaminide alpha-2,6-sialyltransferase [Urocitellus parryii]
MKARDRLLLIILCSLVFSAVYVLLCCWACLPLCLTTCLEDRLPPLSSRPTVSGPLHFSGYSSVPDGKVSCADLWMYPGLQIYTFTERMMAYCDQIFQDETGKNRRQSGSFLSTGWFTMILALELCEEIVVYGMVSDSYCREKSHPSVPYHYFEKGRLDECQMYLAHEQAPRSAHRFITEKAVFSRWAKKRPIVFAHPSWQPQ